MDLIKPLKDHTSRARSLAKAFTWRITATSTTSLIAYGVIREVDAALVIGGIEFIFKFAIYYFHERAWNLVR